MGLVFHEMMSKLCDKDDPEYVQFEFTFG